MVGVARADAGPVPLGALGEDDVRLDPADLAADVAAQLLADLELAVRVAEVGDVVDAEHLAGGPLLRLADAGDLTARHVAIEAAGVAVRTDAVEDLHACLGEGRDGSPGSEVDIIGVGGHDEYSLDGVQIQHCNSRTVEVFPASTQPSRNASRSPSQDLADGGVRFGGRQHIRSATVVTVKR